VHSDSLTAKTTSHLLTTLLLRAHGIELERVRITAAGARWETVSAALKSGTVDAIMIDEPFATRLVDEGAAFVLFSTGNPQDVRNLSGAGFLRVALNARRDRAEGNPELTAKVVRMFQRTLAWLAQHSPEQTADALAVTDPVQRAALVTILRKNPRQYSRDGKFSAAQLIETQAFFRASNADNAAAQRLSISAVVVDRWVGRKP
jgi:NitT/TauT family transport system substrate-binding protein